MPSTTSMRDEERWHVRSSRVPDCRRSVRPAISARQVATARTQRLACSLKVAHFSSSSWRVAQEYLLLSSFVHSERNRSLVIFFVPIPIWRVDLRNSRPGAPPCSLSRVYPRPMGSECPYSSTQRRRNGSLFHNPYRVCGVAREPEPPQSSRHCSGCTAAARRRCRYYNVGFAKERRHSNSFLQRAPGGQVGPSRSVLQYRDAPSNHRTDPRCLAHAVGRSSKRPSGRRRLHPDPPR